VRSWSVRSGPSGIRPFRRRRPRRTRSPPGRRQRRRSRARRAAGAGAPAPPWPSRLRPVLRWPEYWLCLHGSSQASSPRGAASALTLCRAPRAPLRTENRGRLGHGRPDLGDPEQASHRRILRLRWPADGSAPWCVHATGSAQRVEAPAQDSGRRASLRLRRGRPGAGAALLRGALTMQSACRSRTIWRTRRTPCPVDAQPLRPGPPYSTPWDSDLAAARGHRGRGARRGCR
jgi:hypothetical protein